MENRSVLNRSRAVAVRSFRTAILIVALGGFGPIASAYVEDTHELLSERAIEMSRELLARRFDEGGVTELDKQERILKGLVRGSRDEDEGVRPLNHFFDPIFARRGSDGSISECIDQIAVYLDSLPGGRIWAESARKLESESAVDWAVSSQLNEFGYARARVHLFHALTSETQPEREAEFAKAFVALGHVVHLIQDMAQPHHVRNDLHLGDDLPWYLGSVSVSFPYLPVRKPCSSSSPVYEKYVTREFVKDLNAAVGEDVLMTRRALSDSAAWRTPRSFWHSPLDSSPLAGRGLADYTSRNFLSEGTNFIALKNGATDGEHPSPSLAFFESRRYVPDLTCAKVNKVSAVPAYQNIFSGAITDFIPQSPTNVLLTTLGLFDQDLLSIGANPRFILTNINYCDYARVLLPQAVAYSAALLKYFFRGGMTPHLQRQGEDISIQVTNDTVGESINGGMFTVYYDAPDGVRTALKQLPAPEIEHGAQASLGSFRAPLAFASGRENRFVVVYRGPLGDEQDSILWTEASAPSSTPTRYMVSVSVSSPNPLDRVTGGPFPPFPPGVFPQAIECPPVCSASLPANSPLFLGAWAENSLVAFFEGWGGECAENGGLFPVMTSDKHCTATFRANSVEATITAVSCQKDPDRVSLSIEGVATILPGGYLEMSYPGGTDCGDWVKTSEFSCQRQSGHLPTTIAWTQTIQSAAGVRKPYDVTLRGPFGHHITSVSVPYECP